MRSSMRFCRRVDGGRFPAKRVAGEAVAIEAHCFTDGHDKLRVMLRWSLVGSDSADYEIEMQAQGQRCLDGGIHAAAAGPLPIHGHRVGGSLRILAARIRKTRRQRRYPRGAAGRRRAHRCRPRREPPAAMPPFSPDGRGSCATAPRNTPPTIAALQALALDPARAAIVARYSDRSLAATPRLELVVDRKRAAFSSWYELFPRSAASQSGQHGTFKDVEARLPYLAEMGFDVLYFPPIHPIGRINRKGTNNSLRAKPGDVGSPWAIGSAEGGHKDILPQLGTFEDFDRLLNVARALGIEIAMDIAFQCAPDHPYVTQHPQWFKHRPDGSVQYAENPPKKYQDIYPFDFETSDWRGLWNELKSIVDFWIARGVKIFRVDNPHTKAFAFWEWLIERDQARASGCHLSGRGLYPAEGHAPSGETGFLAVLHLFHLAQYQAGADRLFHRT